MCNDICADLPKTPQNNKNEIIEIGGFCKSSQVCNEWVQELRNLNWIKKIELVEFKFNKDNIGEFIIEVSY